jgi:hypothetical protein
MPYFTRIKEMDRVGVEPTTSADMQSLVVPYLLKDGKAIERTAQPFLSS